jgi:DNA repair protein RadC
MISDTIYAIKPIEKLEQFGPSSLDNAELLALLLGGDRYIECSRKMLQYYGRLTHIASAVTAELADIPGIGRVADTNCQRANARCPVGHPGTDL